MHNSVTADLFWGVLVEIKSQGQVKVTKKRQPFQTNSLKAPKLQPEHSCF